MRFFRQGKIETRYGLDFRSTFGTLEIDRPFRAGPRERARAACGEKSDGRRAVRLNSAPTFSNPRIRNAPWFIPLVERDNLRKEIKFAGDSPLEGDGFEPSVSRVMDGDLGRQVPAPFFATAPARNSYVACPFAS
jgi:hypothetical protein